MSNKNSFENIEGAATTPCGWKRLHPVAGPLGQLLLLDRPVPATVVIIPLLSTSLILLLLVSAIKSPFAILANDDGLDRRDCVARMLSLLYPDVKDFQQ